MWERMLCKGKSLLKSQAKKQTFHGQLGTGLVVTNHHRDFTVVVWWQVVDGESVVKAIGDNLVLIRWADGFAVDEPLDRQLVFVGAAGEGGAAVLFALCIRQVGREVCRDSCSRENKKHCMPHPHVNYELHKAYG